MGCPDQYLVGRIVVKNPLPGLDANCPAPGATHAATNRSASDRLAHICVIVMDVDRAQSGHAGAHCLARNDFANNQNC
jgi:hypothetical protein